MVRGEKRVEPDEGLNDLATRVVAAAFEVHKALGPGYAESVYEEALGVELKLAQIEFQRQAIIAVTYKGFSVGEGRLDLLVKGCLVVELKTVEVLSQVHFAQVVSYLRATRCVLGLLINFQVPQLRQGIRRVILSR